MTNPQSLPDLHYRFAALDDVPFLAAWNRQLIEDEHHRNTMTLPQLETRMAGWLQGEYKAVIFEQADQPVAYALYRLEPDHVYLRHFFVAREHRRQGIGVRAMHLLMGKILDSHQRLVLDVLIANPVGLQFWKQLGFQEYAITLERRIP